MEAAIDVFAQNGFSAARVSDVAKAAGVADGTIYNYFRNKDDLLICLFEDRMETLVGTFRQELSGCPDARSKLGRFIQLHLQLAEQQPALAEVLTVELRQSAKFMREYKARQFGEYLEVLAEVITEGQRTGEFALEGDVRVMTRAIFGALDETNLVWLRGKRTPGTLVANAPTLQGIFLQGLMGGTA
ncbi:MAG: TetR/AcrR family transcriptional regulator [Bradymonadia bacterium]